LARIVKWLAVAVGAGIGALATWQISQGMEVPKMIMLIRVIIYAIQAVLTLALDRPRARAANS
jgi:hypothetical protein